MLRHLKLNRPLVSFDTETTGFLPHGRIVELSVVRIDPNMCSCAMTYRVNPGVPIPPDTSAIHGIYDADVAGCPTFDELADQIMPDFFDCDITGFNIKRFDLPLIYLELERIDWTGLEIPGNVVDVMQLFHRYFPPAGKGTGTLGAAYQRYMGSPMVGAHGALMDALASVQILDVMVGYHKLPPTIADLAAFMGGRKTAAGSLR